MAYSIRRIKCKKCEKLVAATWLSRHRCGQSLTMFPYFEEKINQLEVENKRLKEVLEKCSPCHNNFHDIRGYHTCMFCGANVGKMPEHFENCEYVNLTGGRS